MHLLRTHARLLPRLICLLVWFSIFSGCIDKTQTATTPPNRSPLITFAVMGDVPYGLTPEEIQAEKDILSRQITELNQDSDLAFVVHVGDIKKGLPPCDQAVYETAARILGNSTHPLFIIPGDNEWNDCKDPEEAWGFWTTHFMEFDAQWPNDLGVVRQADRPENFAFVRRGVLFAGINLVGGKVHDWQEWETRIRDNRQWLETQFRLHAGETQAAVIFTHANPGKTEAGRFIYNKNAFQPLIEYLDAASETDYPKPILFVHGDGHKWIQDNPFPTAGDRITRVQVTQGGLEAPLKIEVHEDPAHPFVLIRNSYPTPSTQ